MSDSILPKYGRRGAVHTIKLMTRGLILCALTSAASLSHAGGGVAHAERAGWRVSEPQRFMVSGVLRKHGAADTIKPIQAVISARSADAAIANFVEQARKDQPDYDLIATLASPIPPSAACVSDI